ncbi:MAG: CDP-alcohol phosphatidyltransferase family protein [Actinomycetota bacterium]
MLSRRLKQAVTRILAPLIGALSRWGVSPNVLTVASLVPAAAAALLAAGHRLLAAGIVLLAGSSLDMLDGAVAKASGKTSSRGAFLDSTIDRVSDSLVLGGLFWHFANTSSVSEIAVRRGSPFDAPLVSGASSFDRWGPHLAVASLVLGFLVPYIKARALSLGFTCEAGLADRPERVVIVALGLMLGRPAIGLAVLAGVSAVSAVQRFAAVWRQSEPPGAAGPERSASSAAPSAAGPPGAAASNETAQPGVAAQPGPAAQPGAAQPGAAQPGPAAQSGETASPLRPDDGGV